MKLSSISLIAVTLAAIAGSTLAAPCALRACESVDGLFKRQPTSPRVYPLPHQDEHRVVEACQEAATAYSKAGEAAKKAAKSAESKEYRTYWGRKYLECQLASNTYTSKAKFHKNLSTELLATQHNHSVGGDLEDAKAAKQAAENVARVAEDDPNFLRTDADSLSTVPKSRRQG